MEALLGQPEDAVFFPEGTDRRGRRGYLTPFGESPYVLLLHDAIIYPKDSLPKRGAGPVPSGLARKRLHLLVSGRDEILPDSFARSHFVPDVLDQADKGWRAHLPAVKAALPGTHLFAEMVFGHFGHMIVDTPSRLWPLHTGLMRPDDVAGSVALPMLGAGTSPQDLPRFARILLEAMSVAPGNLTFLNQPTRVERLVVARRFSPHLGGAYPQFNAVTQAAGRVIGARSRLSGPLPKRLFLSRSRLSDDPRGGPAQAVLDKVFESRGFSIIHPQELPLEDQIAMVRAAERIAGPFGSQLHLCAFSETPGLKLFSIGPSRFHIKTNERILAPLHGVETCFKVSDDDDYDGPRHKAPWRLSPADLPNLHHQLDEWLMNSPGKLKNVTL